MRRAARHLGQAHVPAQRGIRHFHAEVFVGASLAHHGCDAAVERQRSGHQFAHPQCVRRIRVAARGSARHQHDRLVQVRVGNGEAAGRGLPGVALPTFIAIDFRCYEIARAGRARIRQIEITPRNHDRVAGAVLERQLKPERGGIRVVGEMKCRHFAAFQFTGVDQVIVVEQTQINLRQLALALDDEMRHARADARRETRIHLAFTGHEQIVVSRNHGGLPGARQYHQVFVARFQHPLARRERVGNRAVARGRQVGNPFAGHRQHRVAARHGQPNFPARFVGRDVHAIHRDVAGREGVVGEPAALKCEILDRQELPRPHAPARQCVAHRGR